MKWKLFKYGGKTYDLSHLDSFSWIYEVMHGSDQQASKKYSINVNFSMHCFTKQPLHDQASCNSDLFYKEPKEDNRIFCFERYELSKKLPEIIKNLDHRNCWHTHHGHFFTIDLLDQSGDSREYEIYFDVHKSNRGWLTLVVKSAYVRDQKHGTTQPRKRKIRFSVIVKNKYENKKLRPPR